MKILGVDPGLGRAGWAIINEDRGKTTAIEFGCIETKKTTKEADRIKFIYSEISRIIKEHSPEVLSIEKLFFNKNVSTALNVGQARGVIILAAANSGLIISEYTPLQVKMAVVGYGRADKNQIGQMVKSIFSLPSVPTPDDTADALAIALTYAVSYKINNLA